MESLKIWTVGIATTWLFITEILNFFKRSAASIRLLKKLDIRVNFRFQKVFRQPNNLKRKHQLF